jgi:hypothetical protein
MNDFAACLEQSHRASDLPFWETCYAAAFPTMLAMHDHRQDGLHQRQGVDRSIVLRNGKTLWVDEKVRGRNKITGRVYEDIALEEWSSLETRNPGWVLKPLFADYIAYAIAPLGRCYLLPVLQLQSAWLVHGEIWKQTAPRILAQNNGYQTLSWGVSPKVLFPAIGDCLRVQFAPVEFSE